MARQFDASDMSCEYRTECEVPYQRIGYWVNDDDIEYKKVIVCTVTGTSCTSSRRFDCPRYANAQIPKLLKAQQDKG